VKRPRYAALIGLLVAARALSAAPPADSRPDFLAPQAARFPDASKMRLATGDDGMTRVEGAAGAIPGAHPMLILSPSTGFGAATRSRADGSFEGSISAPPGSWVLVKYDPFNLFEPERPWRLPQFGLKPDSGSAGVAEYGPSENPGTWLRAPCAIPRDEKNAFCIGFAMFPSDLDFTIRGGIIEDKVRGTIRASGKVTVYPDAAAAAGLAGTRLEFGGELDRLFDARGKARAENASYFSDVLTPTGLPIEHQRRKDVERIFNTGPLARDAGGASLSAAFSFELPLPKSIEPGTYAMWLRPSQMPHAGAARKGKRGGRNRFLTRSGFPLPPLALGRASRPRLVWTLLTDALAADGSRGTAAAEDGEGFQLASHVVTQAASFIVPRVSRATGEPLTYRLEPYLPMISQGERRIPNVPVIPFKFPSGRLEVSVTRPDGTVDALGSAPFAGAHGRSPVSGEGEFIHGHGGNLLDVYQLSTETGLFDYRFPMYGEYIIKMTGEVADAYGNSYDGGGTYKVFVAEALDIEPAVLPMTPFQVGDALNPGVTVLPGVPADVEIKVTLLAGSDKARRTDYRAVGRANRFGIFTPLPGARRMEMTSAGEFVVETTARYTDAGGVLWMGATRWGQVVESPGRPVLARGRRGRHQGSNHDKQWFVSPETGATHIQFPFASGDVLWQSKEDSAIPAMTMQDLEGKVEKTLRSWARKGCYAPQTNPEDSLAARTLKGELPLMLTSCGGAGYWYAAAERPGERVREIQSEDGAVDSGYWRFSERYAAQPGVGYNGDQPGDLKFLYGGTVFRDPARGLARYGIYGALWVLLPQDDPTGSRVFPPFRGANGGPDGGPLLTVKGRELDAFVVPLAVRPGSILESGGAFSFSASLAPALPAAVEIVVSGPGDFRRTIKGRSNAIGYFYQPDADFLVERPGVYHVAVSAAFDSPTSAGPMQPPYPSGTVLGAVNNGFDFYVVDPRSSKAATKRPFRSVVPGVWPVSLDAAVPDGLRGGTLYYTIGMPGFQLETGSATLSGSEARVIYDPIAMNREFPNIDLAPGLADTIWASMILIGKDGTARARNFALEGPDLYAP